MQDLAMISLELVQNALDAKATSITMTLALDQPDGTSSLILQDNGIGMDEKLLKQVRSPFTTTRTTRKVGLGLAFFSQAIQQADGTVTITSQPGQGTTVTGIWKSNHWDAPPLGNLGEVVLIALQSHPDVHLQLIVSVNAKTTTFDSKVLASSLAPVSIAEPAILMWIENDINANIQHCKGGNDHEES